ncbi:MAG TPA: arylsulfotransferase family protein [Chthonomonadaceae bacterium]|nr:arylsulfotransferase family protein [Chthonomonadaceae bacterium]
MVMHEGRRSQGLAVRLRKRARTAVSVLGLAASGVVMALTSSCGGGGAALAPTPGGGSPAPGAIEVTTSERMTPAFDPAITDYVVSSKTAGPVQVMVTAASGNSVSVDGKPFQSQSFTTPVAVSAGQSFPVTVRFPGGTKTFFFRRLPSDFPTWTLDRAGTPQAEYYLIAPDIGLAAATPSRDYVIFADTNGVPVWWYKTASAPIQITLLPNGDVAWLTQAQTGEERSLTGALKRSFVADPGIGGNIDNHELRLLPNGDYLVFADVARGPVDLSAIGGLPFAAIIDTVVEEVTPSGSLVFHWSAMDHIPFSEVDPAFRAQYVVNAEPADPFHMNSLEDDGTGIVISFRHESAVYRIDKATGNIVWKLGGVPRAESLAFVGDSFGNFGGQHDARILTDETLTVHDNGTQQGRPPRAARYRIDTAARTATLIEQVTDATAPSSLCCGSARKLAGGDWVVSWGLNPEVAELTPTGANVLRFTFGEPYFSYRAEPVAPGVLSRSNLRAGMDAQFPR